MILTVCIAAVTASACGAARWYLNRTSRRETEYGRGRVRLTALWNGGGAFGLPIKRKTLTALSAAGLALVPALAGRCRLGAGLILGGGLSNLWERLRHGRVYDYVRFPKAPGKLKRCVFNLADFAIFLGGLLVLLGCGRKRGKTER